MQPFVFIIPDVEGKTVTEVLNTTVELRDDYLIMIEEYYGDFKDEDLGTVTNQLRKHTDYHLRSKISGCHKHWYCKTKVWGVQINLIGASQDLSVCFKRESQAQELCDAIITWLLK